MDRKTYRGVLSPNRIHWVNQKRGCWLVQYWKWRIWIEMGRKMLGNFRTDKIRIWIEVWDPTKLPTHSNRASPARAGWKNRENVQRRKDLPRYSFCTSLDSKYSKIRNSPRIGLRRNLKSSLLGWLWKSLIWFDKEKSHWKNSKNALKLLLFFSIKILLVSCTYNLCPLL